MFCPLPVVPRSSLRLSTGCSLIIISSVSTRFSMTVKPQTAHLVPVVSRAYPSRNQAQALVSPNVHTYTLWVLDYANGRNQRNEYFWTETPSRASHTNNGREERAFSFPSGTPQRWLCLLNPSDKSDVYILSRPVRLFLSVATRSVFITVRFLATYAMFRMMNVIA